MLVDEPSKVSVGEDALKDTRIIDEQDGACSAGFSCKLESVAEASGLVDHWEVVANSKAKDFGDGSKPSPEHASGVACLKSIGVEVGAASGGKGEGIADGEHRRCRSGRREVERARFGDYSNGEMDCCEATEAARGRRADADELDAVCFENRSEGNDFLGFAGVRKKHRDVTASKASEVTMNRFGGMKEMGGAAEAREGRTDLAPDETRLAEAGDDDVAVARFDEVDRRFPLLIVGGDGSLGDAKNGVRFCGQDLADEGWLC